MNNVRAAKILNIPLDASNEEIKRAYRKMALKYHPDKSTAEDANEKFQEIHDAYMHLTSDKPGKSMDYITLLRAFLNTFYNEVPYNEVPYNEVPDNSSQIVYEWVKKIILSCEEKAMDLMKNIDKNILKKIYEITVINKEIFHLSDEFLQKINKIVVSKFELDERIILHPFLSDVLENNIFRLEVESDTFIVPLWHHHLVYDTKYGGEIFVDCYPILPDNMWIDEYNNLHTIVEYNLYDIWSLEIIVVDIGINKIEIPKNELLMSHKQTKIVRGRGISRIISNNLYDISERGDVYITISIVL